VSTGSPNASGAFRVDLAGKVALVTGATRGLGRAMTDALAASGADVVVTSRDRDSCARVAKEVAEATGRRAYPRPCHMGHWEEISGLVDDAYAEMGSIEILVSNAGMSPLYKRLETIDEALFDKTIAVNLKGPFRLGSFVGARMADGDGGSIINISSTAAVRPQPAYLPYAAAKAGLNALAVGLARAFGPKVRSNVVMAGPFATDATAGWDWEAFNEKVKSRALQRIGQQAEIVGAVLYFASDASSYTTGTVLTVNGGEP
jgi:NAD(P)-dependent dehydrogenase (short-subunit alcohol dehydrogenase family)